MQWCNLSGRWSIFHHFSYSWHHVLCFNFKIVDIVILLIFWKPKKYIYSGKYIQRLKRSQQYLLFLDLWLHWSPQGGPCAIFGPGGGQFIMLWIYFFMLTTFYFISFVKNRVLLLWNQVAFTCKMVQVPQYLSRCCTALHCRHYCQQRRQHWNTQ